MANLYQDINRVSSFSKYLIMENCFYKISPFKKNLYTLSQIQTSKLTYQILNGELPTRKGSIKVPAMPWWRLVFNEVNNCAQKMALFKEIRKKTENIDKADIDTQTLHRSL